MEERKWREAAGEVAFYTCRNKGVAWVLQVGTTGFKLCPRSQERYVMPRGKASTPRK